MDFVDETASFFAWSPKTLLIAVVSILSPWGVDVPCALMYWTSSGFAPASRSVFVMTREGPSPSSEGALMWYASPDMP